MPELGIPQSKLSRDDIKLALKRIDRKLKISSTDPEITGVSNALVQSFDDLPLTLYSASFPSKLPVPVISLTGPGWIL